MLTQPTADSISDLSHELERSVGIFLPPETMQDDLIRVLLVSLRQHRMSIDEDDNDEEIIDAQSIFMSLPEGKKMPLTKTQADELVKLGAVNPKTSQPFVLEDFEVQAPEDDPVRQYALALTKELTSERQSNLRTRVNGLIATGRTSKEYADAKLFPCIDKYELSLGSGAAFEQNNVDLLVESLESLPASKKVADPSASFLANTLPAGANIADGDPGDGEGSKMTAEDAEKMKTEFLSML